MLKKDVILRTEVRTVYSSEKQERMKIYFELSDEFEKCSDKCNTLPEASKIQCQSKCEEIYNQYVDKLQGRYQDGNEERIDMEVKDAPIFTSKRRKDRNSLFYDITGKSWDEMWNGTSNKPRRTDTINEFYRYDDQNRYSYQNNPDAQYFAGTNQNPREFQQEADI